MKKEMITQVKLRCMERLMTTWLPADPRIKEGTELTLKDVSGRWKVESVYSTLPRGKVNKGKFDNNNYDKHKGLGL